MNQMIEIVKPGGIIERDETIRSGAARLSGRLFLPRETPQAAVVLNGATGVPHGYYGDFARWLATDRGLACLTYDYSDFGASARRHMRASKATMGHWGIHDQQAARDHLARLLPDKPLWVIGHSLGALCLPMQQGLNRIDRIIAVASGPVHLTDHPWHYRPVAAAFWHGPTALATLALGYMPGRSFGLGADLPAGVYWQWRRWCTQRGFYAREAGSILPWPDRQKPDCPLRAVAVADDPMIPPHTVWKLMQLYPETTRSQKVLRPAEYGLPKIGHIGAFHRRAQACWPDILGS